jgi:hypothetical protein
MMDQYFANYWLEHGLFTFFPFRAASTSSPLVPTLPNTFLSSIAEADMMRFPTT